MIGLIVQSIDHFKKINMYKNINRNNKILKLNNQLLLSSILNRWKVIDEKKWVIL
jgi:hypothetical protein